MIGLFRSHNRLRQLLKEHFGRMALTDVVSVSRTFPIASRADLQTALDHILGERYQARLLGLHHEYVHETLSFADVAEGSNVRLGPVQYEEVDIGETTPKRCVKHGLWLARAEALPFGVVITQSQRFGHAVGVHMEIAVPAGEAADAFCRRLFDEIEHALAEAGSYRGKVISLEAGWGYPGAAGHVRVHRVQPVKREEIILPKRTIQLIERNIHEFLELREGLCRLGFSAKKGLLFYGPPGTGKTYTIHYLAGQLPRHTTLLITSEQVDLLEEYFRLARLLQPALVVIEDVDLIARPRDRMRNAWEESSLSKLLNEMDGLREDVAALFILTTNRPEQLETALASRPGRIDQAIEFPLPDEQARRKLVHLYARGLRLSEDVVQTIVKKTAQASPAFIRELLRRIAQYHLRTGQGGEVQADHVQAALEEMLFAGGSLNLKLLGVATEE